MEYNITMDVFNSSKTIDTAVTYASVASTSKISRIRLDTTLYHYLYIVNNSARCAVDRWIYIDSEKDTYYCSS